MTATDALEIFLVTAPGFEPTLAQEASDLGFVGATPMAGGVAITGGWPDVWRANLEIRGANRILVGIAAFRAMHLAQLDKRARRVEWAKVLRPDVPFRVEVSCKASRIYHSGAAAQRIETAIRESLGAACSPDAVVCVKARIDDDLCSIGVDTSGALLHKRGYKEAVNSAPMRETLASLFLRQCGFDGRETVVDPMCGSGTFVIEAAQIAAGIEPGRLRNFAFELLATFDAEAWRGLRESRRAAVATGLRFHGSDRDEDAVAISTANAARAGVAGITEFRQLPVSELVRPEGAPGLVIVNPPYGTRIGDKERLQALYRALGHTLAARFSGYRIGLITSDAALARATHLPFGPPGAPVPHGGLRVTLYRTQPLP